MAKGKGYDLTDASPRGLFRTGVGLIVAAVLTHFGLRAGFFSHRRVTQPVLSQPKPVPAPDAELKAYLAAERGRLSAYAWVDREKGIAKIPIDRAIELMASRHKP